MAQKNEKSYKMEHPTPFRFLLITAVSVFIAESLIMLIFASTIYLSFNFWLIDAMLLTVMIIPILYFFLYRPMALNINQRRQAEAELRQSETRLKEGERFLASIFAGIQDGLTVLDNEMTIIRTNPAVEKWYAHAMPLVGKSFSLVFREFGEQGESCPCSKTIATGKSHYGVNSRKAPDGTAAEFLEHYSFPLLDINTKQTKGVILYSRNITEKYHMEREMARFESLNLVGEMAAGIGHEVRNPMTTVRGFLQLFENKKEFLSYQEIIKLMIEELDRANSIISEFLSLSKNRAVDLKKQNINAIIKALFPLIRADAMVSEKNVQLSLEEIPELPLNEKEIRQLILNIVRNGLEAMAPGKTMAIATYIDGKEVVLSIKDQGTGIEPAILEKLGTPFFTTKETGTGLGLAVCYSIAAKHNANINLETGPEGTTFYVKFKI